VPKNKIKNNSPQKIS